MSEAVKNLLKDVGVDFGEKDSKDNTENITLLKEENEQRRFKQRERQKKLLAEAENKESRQISDIKSSETNHKVQNLLKDVGVNFGTEEPKIIIETKEEKLEKIRLIEEKRAKQKRRNKVFTEEIKPKHSIFEDKSPVIKTDKTSELLKDVGIDFKAQETIEEKIENFEEKIKEDLQPYVEEPIQKIKLPELNELLPKKITAEPSEFPNAVVDAIDGMYEGKFYLDRPDLPDRDLISTSVNRISDAAKEPLIEISPFRQELELFRKSITEQIGKAVSLGGGSGSGEVLLQRLDDVDDSNKSHGTTLAWSSVTQKYEAADPDLNAGISLEDDSGDEIIIDATASGGADEGGKILQEDNTRTAVSDNNTTVSSMSFSTPTITLTDSAGDEVTVSISSLADSALATISTAGKVDIGALEIDGATEMGGALVDADLLIVDDGAGGTEKSMLASRIKTYVGAAAGAFGIANLDIDGGTDIGEAIVDADLFIVDNGAGGTNRKTAASRIATYTTAEAVGTANTWTAGQRGEITALSDGSTITIDMADSNNFSVTLGGNRTFANPSNDTAGQCGSIFITQDGTGSRTASWGTDWDFAGGTAPTLTTTAAAVDRVDYVILDSTNIHAVATLAYS